jgi:outer membrane protein TolC
MRTTTRTATALRLSCIAAASLVASRAMALQPLEVFLAAARERNPDAQQARANLAAQDAQALVALGRQLPGVSATLPTSAIGTWSRSASSGTRT